MNTSINKILCASGLVLSLSLVSGSLSAKSHDKSQDFRQQIQISTSYELSPILRRDQIEVSVIDGTAILSGKVSDEVNKELAGQIALGVKGVKDLDNNITVDDKHDNQVDQDDTSFGEMIDDATISARIKSKLLWSKYTDGMDTEVETKAGKVILKGHTASATTKQLASRMAQNTSGVRSVDNRLDIKPTSKKSSIDKAEQAISDSWITTKVKSTFMYSSNVDSSNISVTTQKGVVTLSGKVLSGAERELATQLAENVRGVSSVNTTQLII